MDMPLYGHPPRAEFPMEWFETLGLERLEVMIEFKKFAYMSRKQIVETKLEQLIEGTHLQRTLEEQFGQDWVSHFVLRLICAGDESLMTDFVNFETLLLEYRLRSKELEMKWLEVMDELNIGYEKVADEERGELKVELNDAYGASTMEDPLFLKLDFKYVVQLVGARQVFLKKGLAYVPQSYVLWVISERFKSQLLSSIQTVARSLPNVRKEDRFRDRLDMFIAHYQKRTAESSNYEMEVSQLDTKVRMESVEMLSSKFFPLCMRELHVVMMQEHHLKYFGRVQLQRFFKDIGMPVDDCARYFEKIFRQGPKGFQERYLYSIRHSYGLAGSNIKYPHLKCTSIMNMSPTGIDHHHGCPFKEYDHNKLKLRIKERNPAIDNQLLEKILDEAIHDNFHTACALHFQANQSHHGPMTTSNQVKVYYTPRDWFVNNVKQYKQPK